MAKVMQYVLRFGPLVAALALGLAAVIEPLAPGYTGIVTSVLSLLGLVGVGPNAEIVELLATVVAGATALVGVARKLISIFKAA